MKHVGDIPSPYGPMIKVMHESGGMQNPEDCYFHNFEDAMTLAGVHGANRENCRNEFKALPAGTMSFDLFLRHGGRTVLKLPIARPKQAAYAALLDAGLHKEGRDIPVEQWVSSVMDNADWYSRAETMLRVLDDNFKESEGLGIPDKLLSYSYSILNTAALEHLVETEIDCIQAAAFYALSGHSEWRKAGREWLLPVKNTWFADWIADRPIYRRFAVGMRRNFSDIPKWISGK